MNKIIIFCFLFILVTLDLRGQCSMDVGSTAPALTPIDHQCVFVNQNISGYIPDDEDIFALEKKTIRLKVHVMQQSAGNPQNYTSENVDFLLDVFNHWINNNLLTPINCPVWNSNGECICDESYCGQIGGPNDCCLVDSKIRVQLEEEDIVFHIDEDGWDGTGVGSNLAGGCPHNSYLFDNFVSEEDCKLNIFFFEPIGSSNGCGMGLLGEAMNHVLMANTFTNTFDNPGIPDPGKPIRVAALALHEILHCIGLPHTNQSAAIISDIFTNEDTQGCDPNSDPDCSNNVMAPGHRSFQNWLSNLQIAFLHRELIGRWRSKLLQVEYDNSKNIVVDQDEVWDIGRVIYGDIFVNAGARLTINCKVIMPPTGKIFVMPGAELVVDDGLITIASSRCGEYWDGIWLFGFDNLSQEPNAAGEYEQGYVEVINEGKIAYANTAIRTVDIMSLETGGGGIIKCNEAEFFNNSRGVEIGPYQLADNVSEFINSTFTIDDNHVGVFSEHALLQEVTDIHFQGCDFANEREFSGGIGIHALDAHFVVEAYCDPDDEPCVPTAWDRSTFSRFWSAVEVAMSGCFLYTYEVDRSDFSLNAIGINSNAVNNPLITRNTMEVGVDYFAIFRPIGVRINGGTGYTVQENIFTGYDCCGPFWNMQHVGVHVRETGQADNEIRRNTYNNLYIGNSSNGNNRNGTNPMEGLHYFCNENAGNTFDFSVPNEPNNPSQEYGISQNQGAFAEAAGNKFSQNANNPESDFLNQSPWAINYFYLLNATDEFPTSRSAFVNPVVTSNPNTCEILYPPFMEPGPGPEPDIREKYWSSFNARISLQQNHSSQIDNGNTNSLLSQIAESTPANANQLANQLLNFSPWLSSTVLKSAANRTDLISHSVMYDILLANSDESKNENFLTYLSTKSDPMPGNMIEAIRNTPFVATPRTQLEADLSLYNSKVTSAAARLTHYFMTDTKAKNRDSVRLWMGRQESLEAEMAIVDSWLHDNNMAKATQVMNNIPQQHQLSTQEQLEYNYFLTLKNLQINLKQQGKCVYDLEANDLQPIIDLAENSSGIAGLQAKNILNSGFGYSIYDEPILPELGQNRKRTERLELKNNRMLAFPNPASDQVQFHYQLDKAYKGVSVRITDSKGFLVEELLLNEGKEGFVSWECSDLKAGIYFFSICSYGHPLDAGKLVIVR